MMYNVWEGVMNVALLMILLPRVAIIGYIAVMYIKEIFNAFLSVRRLTKVTSIDFGSMGLIKTLICSIAAGVLCGIAFPSAIVWTKIAGYIAFYVSLLYIGSAVSRDDIRWILRLCKENTAKNVDKMAS